MATDRLDNHLILLVEDEPFIQMDIQQGLEEAGARVCAAADDPTRRWRFSISNRSQRRFWISSSAAGRPTTCAIS